MDKSLDGIRYAEEYLQAFPEMRFIGVVRDPRAQVSSMTEAIIHDFTVIGNCITYIEAYEELDRYRQPIKIESS